MITGVIVGMVILTLLVVARRMQWKRHRRIAAIELERAANSYVPSTVYFRNMNGIVIGIDGENERRFREMRDKSSNRAW